MKEQVKEILYKIPVSCYCETTEDYIEKAAQEICDLFLKGAIPVLSDEEIEAIYQREYKSACEFSEHYDSSLSPKNFNPNRPADRQRTFNTTHRERVARAVAQAQYDTLLPYIQQARQEGRESILDELKAGEISFQGIVKEIRDTKAKEVADKIVDFIKKERDRCALYTPDRLVLSGLVKDIESKQW